MQISLSFETDGPDVAYHLLNGIATLAHLAIPVLPPGSTPHAAATVIVRQALDAMEHLTSGSGTPPKS